MAGQRRLYRGSRRTLGLWLVLSHVPSLFLLNEEYAFPKQVNKATSIAEQLDGFFKGRDPADRYAQRCREKSRS